MRGTQLLGPISMFFIISILRIEHQKKHDSKKDTRKNHRADFPIQIACYNKIRTALHSPYFVEYESRMTYRIRTPSALRTITELMTSFGTFP